MPDRASFRNTARPSRLVSMEQEFTSGRYDLASALQVGRHSYHDGPRGRMQELTMESDSSCDGELIYSMYDLADADQAHAFSTTVHEVDGHRARGLCTVGYSAGLHVHVDMAREPFATCRALYLVFNHLEDALYRLASAGYGQHRDEYTGSSYSPPPQKGLRRAVELSNHMRHGRGGLNLANYLAGAMQCACGAGRLGAWEECECTLSQPTVEFRLWNATTRPRKVHAYVALSHALVEWAREHHKVNPNRLTERPYRPSGGTPGASRASLTFMFRNLPLSVEEKTSILWTVRRSSLAALVGEAFLAELAVQHCGQTEQEQADTQEELVTAQHHADSYDDDDDDERDF